MGLVADDKEFIDAIIECSQLAYQTKLESFIIHCVLEIFQFLSLNIISNIHYV